LVAYNGSFTITTQAAPATQVVSGVGFQPKAVIFFWTRQDVTDTKQDHIRAGYGFTSGSGGQRAVALASDHGLDANTAADTGRMQSDTSVILMLNDGAPALGAEAQLVSLDGDGFTLNWISNEGRSDIIHFIALGGTDLTGAQAGTFTKQSGTGGQPVGGIGFQPDFLMLMSINSALTSATQGKVNLGFASSSAKEVSIGVQLDEACLFCRTTHVYQRSDRVFVEIGNTGVERRVSI
jgi:hypothetical protein